MVNLLDSGPTPCHARPRVALVRPGGWSWPARAKGSRPAATGIGRAVRLAVLAALLIAGGATALYLSVVTRQHADGLMRYVRVDVWAVQQVEYELQQFRAVLARHVAGGTDATGADVRDRLARSRSAVSLLRRSDDYQDYRLLADVDGTASIVTVALDEVAHVLADRTDFQADLTVLRRVEFLLEDPVRRVRQLAADVAHVRRELQDGDLTTVRWLTGINFWMLAGSLSVAVVFIIFLLSEARAARRAETQASEARGRLTEAIESIEEGFALYDRNDRIVLCNKRFKHLLFGADPPPCEHLGFADAMRRSAEAGRIPAAGGRLEEWLRECLAYHRAPVGIFDLQLCDGTHLRIAEHETLDGGRVAIYADITEMQRRERTLHDALQVAEVANRSKTEFLANMSHELRTPLNAIIGFSEMSKMEVFGAHGAPQYKAYACDIHDSAQHLLGIINDILDVSKIEAGQQTLNETVLSVGDVIESSLRLIRERAESAGHELAVELPEDLPALRADERAMKQILLNLLTNAVKFTPEGGRISVRARLADDGGLELRVIDTGIGIAEKDIPTALSFFGQVDAKLERKYEGTGLGLPLVRNFVELHGGTMRLLSEVDAGTTVILDFPPERVVGWEHPSNSRTAAL